MNLATVEECDARIKYCEQQKIAAYANDNFSDMSHWATEERNATARRKILDGSTLKQMSFSLQ